MLFIKILFLKALQLCLALLRTRERHTNYIYNRRLQIPFSKELGQREMGVSFPTSKKYYYYLRLRDLRSAQADKRAWI